MRKFSPKYLGVFLNYSEISEILRSYEGFNKSRRTGYANRLGTQ